ncbi:MAG: type II toxin-antitoxin system RelE/ParE family toxin [Clostridiales bacterium]|nr:type II toxin-antitoxin system RelE/ParE family toxin [Clostridiales bacterium]
MSYHVEFTVSALQELKKLDRQTSALILGWIRKNLEGCGNPRSYGKALAGNLSGRWRYRIGDYRLIADIDDEKILILVLCVGHRRDIYERFL